MKRSIRPYRMDKRNECILNRYLKGEKPDSIAADYCITPSRVRQIVQRESQWMLKGFYND